MQSCIIMHKCAIIIVCKVRYGVRVEYMCSIVLNNQCAFNTLCLQYPSILYFSWYYHTFTYESTQSNMDHNFPSLQYISLLLLYRNSVDISPNTTLSSEWLYVIYQFVLPMPNCIGLPQHGNILCRFGSVQISASLLQRAFYQLPHCFILQSISFAVQL